MLRFAERLQLQRLEPVRRWIAESRRTNTSAQNPFPTRGKRLLVLHSESGANDYARRAAARLELQQNNSTANGVAYLRALAEATLALNTSVRELRTTLARQHPTP